MTPVNDNEIPAIEPGQCVEDALYLPGTRRGTVISASPETRTARVVWDEEQEHGFVRVVPLGRLRPSGAK